MLSGRCLPAVLVVAGLCRAEACDLWSPLDECDLQVELIQTASILEDRAVTRQVTDSLKGAEDAPVLASAFDKTPNSLMKALLAKMKQSGMLIMESNRSDTGATKATNATNATATGSGTSLHTPNPFAVLGAASAFSVSMILLVLCLFGCLRDQYPSIYLKKVNELGSHEQVPPDITSSFAWMTVCWRLPVDEIANFSNLDHGMLVQFCDAAVMCLLSTGLPALLILCPLCAFAGAGNGSHLGLLSFANVAKGSWITYLYPAFVWYTVVVSQAFLFRAQRAFNERRTQWLRTMTEPRANSILLSDIPENLLKEEALRAYLEGHVLKGKRIKSVSFVKETRQLEKLVAERERVSQEMQRFVQGTDRQKAVARAEISKVESQVSKLQNIIENSDDYNLNSAFVTFQDRHDAMIVLKVFAPDGDEEMEAELPPDTDDIIWSDLRPSQSQWIYDFMGYFLLLCSFVVFVPLVAYNSIFTEVSIWEKIDSHVTSFMNRNPVAVVFSDAVLAPLLLMFLMGILCSIIASIFVNFFLLKARGVVQYMVQRWYYVYMVIFVLFLTAVGKSLAPLEHTFDYFLKNPKEIPRTLVGNLSHCILFYMDFIILSCGVKMLTLLRLMPLYRYRIQSFFYEDQIAIVKAEPEDQDYNGMGARSARLSVCYIVVLVLSTISPVITLLGAILFAICRVVFTYLFVYAETLKPDLGGLFWLQQLKHVQHGTFLYIVLMTVLLLERGPNYIPGILCGLSGLFMAFSHYTFLHAFRLEQLDFKELPAKDSDEGTLKTPRREYGYYKQPELPPPQAKEKENTKTVQRAATNLRTRFNTTCCDVMPERRERRTIERQQTTP